MKGKVLLKTALAVTATAVAGSLGTDPRSTWYQRLKKPPWQPPPQAFPLVWTPLYGLITYAGARAFSRTGPERGQAVKRALTANLLLNAAWPALFFRTRTPKLALAEILVLNASNVLLIRRTWPADRRAALALLPYAGWTVFATALNTAIARRNP
ncbi:TspO/MBR family protein [Nonomuraea sp. NPDC049421]|uniref:TspO/MBR family protein n=1 Tax=Nonomuraea sp. NPDC049421 TaxID=3155275 RepID=UPI00343A185A